MSNKMSNLIWNCRFSRIGKHERLYYEILRSLFTLGLSYFPHIIFFPVEAHTFRVYVRVSHDLRKSLAHHRKISMDTSKANAKQHFLHVADT